MSLLNKYYCSNRKGYNLLEKVCPGQWFEFHTKPLIYKDDDIKLNIIIIELIDLKDNFFCSECREHIKSFYEKYPLNEYIKNKMKDNGYSKSQSIFRWTWLLHNNVNDRLDKETMPYSLAYDMYTQITKNKKGCSEVCRK